MEAVRGAEQVQEATTGEVVGTRGAAGGGDRLGAAFGLDLVQAVSDLLDALIVRDLLPLALALLADALEHVVDAGGMIDVQQRAGAAAAQASLVAVVGIAFDLDDVTVFDVCENTAVRVAEIAQRLDHLDARSVDIDFGRHDIGTHQVLQAVRLLGNLRHLPSPLLLVMLAFTYIVIAVFSRPHAA